MVKELIVSEMLVPGLPRSHPESYHSYMWNNFFKHIDIDPSNAYILDGNAPDLKAECDAFERKIEEAGGIDLFVGGKCQWCLSRKSGLFIEELNLYISNTIASKHTQKIQTNQLFRNGCMGYSQYKEPFQFE